MINKYDLQKLQDLPIEQVAEAVGLEVRKHKSLCPFHSDSRPSLTFNVRKNRYRCYVCDARGGSIDLVMHHLNLTFRDACHWLAKTFGILIDDDNDRSFQNVKPRQIRPIREIRVQDEMPDIEYLSRLMCQPVINEYAAKFLFEDRKLNREVIRQLGISSIAYSCPMSSSPRPCYFDGPALLIPYRDIDGKLLSVQSRYLGSLPIKGEKEGVSRFKFPKGSRCSIFNLPALKVCDPHNPIFITEGVSDCLAMMSAGFKSIAIPSATLLSEEYKQLLSSLAPKLKWHMYPDADEPGNKLFEQLKELIPNLVRHNLPLGFKDVGQYYAYIHKDGNSNL